MDRQSIKKNLKEKQKKKKLTHEAYTSPMVPGHTIFLQKKTIWQIEAKVPSMVPLVLISHTGLN